MPAQVTVVAVAAALAVVSALLALVLLRYGIPRAARNGPTRNGQETVGCSVVLGVGNVVLVVAFLWSAVQLVHYGVDSRLLFGLIPTPVPTPVPTSALTTPPTCCHNDRVGIDPSVSAMVTTWVTLFVALFWYALSIAVLSIELSAGKSRGHRRSASSA